MLKVEARIFPIPAIMILNTQAIKSVTINSISHPSVHPTIGNTSSS